MKLDPAIASLCNSYRNLAQLWRARADAMVDSRNIYEIANCVRQAEQCDRKARELELRYIHAEY